MKTIESIRNIITAQSVESFRAVLKSMRSNVEQLDTIQSETVRDGGKVSDSVRTYIKAVGLDAAVATVATIVNRDAWDGRISSRNSEWAASVEDAWDREAALEWSIYSKMHKAHLDQFATELRIHGAEYAAEIEAEKAKAAEEAEQTKFDRRVNALVDRYGAELDKANSTGYDYMTAVIYDVAQYIRNNVTLSDYEDADALREDLNDTLWTEDSVTGNGSGSYTFSREDAKRFVIEAGLDHLVEAMREFGQLEEIGPKMADGEWEHLDVTIRCYLLGQAVDTVLDDLELDDLLRAA